MQGSRGIKLLFSAVVNQTLSTVEMYLINCSSYFCSLVIWIHDIKEFLSRVSDVPMS